MYTGYTKCHNGVLTPTGLTIPFSLSIQYENNICCTSFSFCWRAIQIFAYDTETCQNNLFVSYDPYIIKYNSVDQQYFTPKCHRPWGQHGAPLGPVGPRWAPCWPHEPWYQGYLQSVPYNLKEVLNEHLNECLLAILSLDICDDAMYVNTLTLRQDCRHFPDIFKCIFFYKNIWRFH